MLSPKQQRRPLPSLLSLYFFYAIDRSPIGYAWLLQYISALIDVGGLTTKTTVKNSPGQT